MPNKIPILDPDDQAVLIIPSFPASEPEPPPAAEGSLARALRERYESFNGAAPPAAAPAPAPAPPAKKRGRPKKLAAAVTPEPAEAVSDPNAKSRELYQSLRNAIELYYDYQQARISYSHRAGDPNETENLSEDDKLFMEALGHDAEVLEKTILKYAASKLKKHPVYKWLVAQRGIADTFAVILLGMIDITKTETPSGLWRLCGLAVINGQAERPTKGQKLAYSPHLKTRMYLLGESFIKAGNKEWRAYYDDYKARKQKEIGTCMLCEGTGLFTPPKEKVAKKCPRCNGTKEAPWGRSDKHLHMAAMRYMVKQFLLAFYVEWRTYEGLPVRSAYSEEYHERMKLTNRYGGR